jgi:TfoX/Sxy family transcriptional regulator of competence genes
LHWETSPPELIDRFGSLIERFPELERRKMFGYPAAFLHGNMVTGLHATRWVVRLDDEGLAGLRAAGGTTFEPMPGRTMKSFAVLPDEIVADDARVSDWIQRAIAHVRSLPPKK